MLHHQKGCLDGQHIPILRKKASTAGPDKTANPCTRCRRCGHSLMKSPITRKWCVTGLLG